MSKFKKTKAALVELNVRALAMEDTLATVASENTSTPLRLQQVAAETNQLDHDVQALAATIAKFVKIAAIEDEDMKQYGPSMVKQVTELSAEFQVIADKAQACKDTGNALLAPVAAVLSAQDEAKRAKLKKAEEKRQRLEQKRLDRERKAIEKKAREKAALEAAVKRAEEEREQEEEDRRRVERAVYEQQRTHSQAREADLQAALARATGVMGALSFKEAFDILNRRSPGAAASVRAMLMRIVKALKSDVGTELNPFLELRIQNERFQQDFGSHPGAEECLIALGYRQHFDADRGSLWVLREPNPESEMDGWYAWSQQVDSAREVLRGR